MIDPALRVHAPSRPLAPSQLRARLTHNERAGNRRGADVAREQISKAQRRAELANSLFHAQGAAIAELERELRDLETATQRRK